MPAWHTLQLAVALALTAAPAVAARPPVALVPERVPCVVADRQHEGPPDRVHLSGLLGARIEVNHLARLARIDTDRLLEGYRHRPGRQAWDGEHVGKWLHAATLAWAYSGDPRLRAMLDSTVARLCATQRDDGYLGTYVDSLRWTEWDVWSHKYNLIGLVTYVRYTGDMRAMATCRGMADLLCRELGDGPGQRDINTTGWHDGMASTSVLEPMVLLYRLTGEPRYMEFCRYIQRAWEQPNGAGIPSRLLAGMGVDRIGDGKAYEMLSCLNGALELYRTTGEAPLLEACLLAWNDITAHRLYPTGATSYHEYFHGEYDFPNEDEVGETCATVTWVQLNAQLLRLTGEARFADCLEQAIYNQLLGAQRPDGSAWCKYPEMEGRKLYTSDLDGQCCLSSGPRGLALLPTVAVTTDVDGLVLNLYDAGTARLELHDGTRVAVVVDTRYPADGRIRVTLLPEAEREFTLRLRIPSWCRRSTLRPGGVRVGPDGYAALHRRWRRGDHVELRLQLEPRILIGDHGNRGKAAVCRGPLVLAADERELGTPLPLSALVLHSADAARLRVRPEPAGRGRTSEIEVPGARVRANSRLSGRIARPRLVPFARAGASGGRYRVWLPLGSASSGNLLLRGVESRSREGNRGGSIIDDDSLSFVVTWSGTREPEDWYAVALPAPITARRFVFVHGRHFHDGGWFDASAGRPRIQVRREEGGEWESIGQLDAYPATTAADGLRGQAAWDDPRFTLRLPRPVTFVAVRVIGAPGCGDAPQQAFSSCGELQAFPE